MKRRPDPVADIYIRADLAAIVDKAARQRGRCLKPDGDRVCAEAWRQLAHAARALMPVLPPRHVPVQLELF